jgi:hypothetical protein
LQESLRDDGHGARIVVQVPGPIGRRSRRFDRMTSR